MSLGERICECRRRAGLTQRQVADAMGVSPSAVTQWELGNVIPRLMRIERLASVLHVDVSDLLTLCHTAPTVPMLKSVRSSSSVQSAEVPDFVLKSHLRAEATLMEDAAMSNVIPKGMIVVFDPLQVPEANQIAVVGIGGGHTVVRRWYGGMGTVLLVADSNEVYPDIVLPKSEVTLLGTVVWAQPQRMLA